MALLQGGTKIGGSGYVKRALYWFNTTSSTPLYIHMKTNMAKGNYVMATIEAEGYNYGTGLPIKCAWCFYSPGWDPSNLYSVGTANYYSGMSADGVYLSTDGYVVIRAYAGGQYFNGFVLNSFTMSPIGAYDISITGATQTSNTGNYY